MNFLKDISFAARNLRNNPGFAITAVITLALGIGASTAIFSVVNAVLLRPLPYSDPSRLAIIWSDMRARKRYDFPIAPGDYLDIKNGVSSFSDITSVTTGRSPLSGDGSTPEQVRTAGVLPNYFKVLGLRVVRGRDFVDADGVPPSPLPPGTPPTARPPVVSATILSYEFWQRRYGGDTTIIGKTLNLGFQQGLVVGVAQPGAEVLFSPGSNIDPHPDLYTAQRIDFVGAQTAPGGRNNVFMRLIGRLKPGASLAVAQQQADRVEADLRDRFIIKKTSDTDLRVEPMRSDLVAGVQRTIVSLLAAAVFVLLIACANVANLLLVRSDARARELAVRSALGGSRQRLISQMLAESLFLGTIGTGIGLLLAESGISLLVKFGPATLPRAQEVRLDPLVLAFAILMTFVATAVFGIVPAIRGSMPRVAQVLRGSGRSSSLSKSGLLPSAVVVAEVAMCFVLLVGCGLMVRSMRALLNTDPGYDAKGVETFFVQKQLRTPDEGRAFMHVLLDQLRAIPGVTSVTSVFPMPLDGNIWDCRWGTERALTDPSAFQQANIHNILPGYFAAMGAHVIAGREFSEADNDTSNKNIIIDDVLAAKAFPNQSAVGRRLYVRISTPDPLWYTVIGVVRHEPHAGLRDDREAVFIPDAQFGFGVANRWAVRSAGDPTHLGPMIRAAISRIDPNLAIAEMQPLQQYVDDAMGTTRFALMLITVFAAIAATLAAVGLYGVLSTVVRQRTAEIGVRVAFGAPTSSIFRMVIGQGLGLSAVGLVAGLIAAFAFTRLMQTMLVGVGAADPGTYSAMVALFLAIALFACWLPARRAASLDPGIALRE